MASNLQNVFPSIRNRQEIETEIQNRADLKALYEQWEEEQQEEFLDFCSGARGIKMLYDSFFKEILNPVTKPERMENLLTLILGQKVRIIQVLPNESSRIADEQSLLIMDIVVELEDGSIANVECQKIGYSFPGQRAACYSADLLMRQYRRVRKKRGRAFSYRDIKKVYTIVFYEHSPKVFHELPDEYIHRCRQKSDTGVGIELLQEFVFLPLDIYFKYHHNRGIRNETEAWLTFLGSDRPEDILELLNKYPEFRELYEDIYELCRNTEKVMGMFSKELMELDRNTVRYMIDEMQTEIEEQKALLADKDTQLADKAAEVKRLQERIAELEKKNK